MSHYKVSGEMGQDSTAKKQSGIFVIIGVLFVFYLLLKLLYMNVLIPPPPSQIANTKVSNVLSVTTPLAHSEKMAPKRAAKPKPIMLPHINLGRHVQDHYPTVNAIKQLVFNSEEFIGLQLPSIVIVKAPNINAFATYLDGEPTIVLTTRTIEFLLSYSSWQAYDLCVWSQLANTVPSRIPPTPYSGEQTSNFMRRYTAFMEEQTRLQQQAFVEWQQQAEMAYKNRNVNSVYLAFVEAFIRADVHLFSPPSMNGTMKACYDQVNLGMFRGGLGYILGHELGHFINGDVSYALTQLQFTPQEATNVDLHKVLGTLLNQAEQREREKRADIIGANVVFLIEGEGTYQKNIYSHRAWAGEGMKAFIELMGNIERLQGAKGMKLPEFLHDHPDWKSRWINVCVQDQVWRGLSDARAEKVCQDDMIRQAREFMNGLSELRIRSSHPSGKSSYATTFENSPIARHGGSEPSQESATEEEKLQQKEERNLQIAKLKICLHRAITQTTDALDEEKKKEECHRLYPVR